MTKLLASLSVGILAFVAAPAFASDVMPDLSTVPTDWSVDRYAPASFTASGDVASLTVDSTGGYENRPSNYQYSFYNTQGYSTSVSGGPGDDLSVYLYIPQSWEDPSNGAVRTDLWVDTTDLDYGIVGFTNFGTNNIAGQETQGAFEYWDDNADGGNGAWTVSNATVNYGEWNLLDIDYTGTSFEYSVNGTLIGTVSDLSSMNANLSTVYLEAYNFNNLTGTEFYGAGNQGTLPSPVGTPYTAEFANIAPAPEPATFGLIGLSLLGLGAVRRKFRA